MHSCFDVVCWRRDDWRRKPKVSACNLTKWIEMNKDRKAAGVAAIKGKEILDVKRDSRDFFEFRCVGPLRRPVKQAIVCWSLGQVDSDTLPCPKGQLSFGLFL